MSKLLTQMLEKALNRYLRLDSENMKQLKTFYGHCIQIQLTDFPVSFYLLFEADCIKVLPHFSGKCTAVIEGKSIDLLSSTFMESTAQRIHVHGDVEIGYQVYGFFKGMDIDWEEHLSRYTGDIVAHQVGSWFRQLFHSMKRAHMGLYENLTEYVQEERSWLPSALEVEDFCQDVEALRQQFERLEAYLSLNAHLNHLK